MTATYVGRSSRPSDYSYVDGDPAKLLEGHLVQIDILEFGYEASNCESVSDGVPDCHYKHIA
jgi:hypothetical protein